MAQFETVRLISLKAGISRSLIRWRMRTFLCGPLLAVSLQLFAPAVLLAQTPDGNRPAVPQQNTVAVYLFWTPSCPHCAKARAFLEPLVRGESRVAFKSLQLLGEGSNERAFIEVSRGFGIEPPAVPLVVVGDQFFVGYEDDATTGAQIRAQLDACLVRGCTDPASPVVAKALADEAASRRQTRIPDVQVKRPATPRALWLPGLGNIETRSLSLPVLTILLAAVDGFNPCAMWVLVFLIGLLVDFRTRSECGATVPPSSSPRGRSISRS